MLESLQYVLQDSRFFGDSVLMSSTVTRKDRPALDPAKMASLYDTIQKKVFKSTSVHEFEKNVIPRINSAVAGICKWFRSTCEVVDP